MKIIIYATVGFLIWFWGTYIMGEFLYTVKWISDHGIIIGFYSFILLITIIIIIGKATGLMNGEEE